MDQITYIPVKDLKPYKNNPRKNAGAVDAVAASIKEFGFRSPIIIADDNTIINGHTRYKAAKKLGLTEAPCVRISDLTEEQIREYRLIDNKTSELSKWDEDLLGIELDGLDFGALEFDFDFTGDLKKRKGWEETKKLCDLKDRVAIRKAMNAYYQSMFKTGKEGKPLTEIKTEEFVHFFAQTAIDFVRRALGDNLSESGWCLMTTPRRRHGTGFHFATAVCKEIAEELQIPFYQDAITCRNRTRIDPDFEVNEYPKEKNVLMYDDIITTGSTLSASRDILISAGYTVWSLISIDNH